jgi:glycosyltransferase involved in cell wall biosynthesis
MSNPTNTTPNLLVIGMATSIHVARWLELLAALDIEVTLISSNASRGAHPRIMQLLQRPQGQLMRLSIPNISLKYSLFLWIADRFLADSLRALLIYSKIKKDRPDLVHVLELQNAGYPASKAYRWLGNENKPPLFVTNYGSDVYWYQKFSSHRKKLKRLFKQSAALSAECSRDLEIARTLGFTGKIFPALPVTGGLGIDQIACPESTTQLSTRKAITIKGYQNKWGRALSALRALDLCDVNALKDYEIHIYSCGMRVRRQALKFSKRTGTKVHLYKKGELSHDDVLRILRTSRIYIGLSTSDGISTSMLEAMSQGAIPIQTNTACANEWIKDNETGHIADLNNIPEIARQINFWLNSNTETIRAQKKNLITITEKYSQPEIKAIVINFYKHFFGDRLYL